MARFVYYNHTPNGDEHINDCVTRAISLASGLPYSEIRKKLFHTSRLLDCESLAVGCYSHLLDRVFEYPRIECAGLTVNEFADKHPRGIYLVRMPQHITTIIDGCVYDIFDCRDKFITNAWEVERE